LFFDGANWRTRGDGANNAGSAILTDIELGHLQIVTLPPTGGADQVVANASLDSFEKLRITASGNVGIGTTNPTAKLDVVGDMKVSGNFIGTINSTGTLALPLTADASTGVLTLGGPPFLHSFGTNNTFLGSNAGNFTTSGIGQNTGIGTSALEANTTGNHNTATGRRALASNTTGNWNTATGRSAMASNTTGSSNSAIGTNALQVNTTGNGNTATGTAALFATTGTNNTASGDNALVYNTTGSSNTAIGAQAGYTLSNENANTVGSNNTYLGAFSGPGVSSASGLTNATAIGANAVVSASNALVLGSIAGVNGAANSVNVGIGAPSPGAKLVVLGSEATANGLDAAIRINNVATGGTSWNMRVGATGTSTPAAGFSISDDSNNYRLVIDSAGSVGIGPTAPLDKLHVSGELRVNSCVKDYGGGSIAGVCASDARFKKDIVPFAPSLDKVVQSQPVYFHWRAEEFPEKHFGTGRSFGLIAQEVEKVLPELVTRDEQGYRAVNYTELPLLTLQAVRELKGQNDALRKDNEAMKARLARLEALFKQQLEVEVSKKR
ncbi:MAG: tail fiber domain-containing protein, partial [Acidobacteria bacterium]|nr:tail fiber domain-containing protein [Acidobacteriota bacterium]